MKQHENGAGRGESSGLPAPRAGCMGAIYIYQDGQMEWRGPVFEADEITLRGWLDKVRDGILSTMMERMRSTIIRPGG